MFDEFVDFFFERDVARKENPLLRPPGKAEPQAAVDRLN
jgi:hypothetical protein